MRAQLIRSSENGPYVGATTLLADGSGWDRSGEAAADRDALEAAKRVTGQAADRLGANYAVKLACGGVVYIFEPGAPRFSLAQSVMVEHGFSPRIVR